MDGELQGEAHRTVSNSHPETRQRFDLRRNLIVLFFLLLQDSPSLPISNEPLVRTITWNSSSPRRRLGSSQNSPNTSRISDPPHNNDIFSQIDEENARGNEEEDRTSSFIPTLRIPDTWEKKQMDRKMRHKTRIEALKRSWSHCVQTMDPPLFYCAGVKVPAAPFYQCLCSTQKTK